MSQLQIQNICLLAQLEEFGLNPKDWRIEVKWPEPLVEVTHLRHSEIRLWGTVCKEKFLLKLNFLELGTVI